MDEAISLIELRRRECFRDGGRRLHVQDLVDVFWENFGGRHFDGTVWGQEIVWCEEARLREVRRENPNIGDTAEAEMRASLTSVWTVLGYR